MKKKILLGLPLLLILLLGVRLLIVYGKQQKEFDYHAALPKTISLESTDFVANGMIPLECSGKGQNTVPSLYWKNLPEGTRSLVVLVTDYDGPAPFLKLVTVDHWIVYNIPSDFEEIKKGITTIELQKDNILLGENFTKGMDYAGPKPPLGVHRYFFRIYALSVPSLKLVQPKKQEVLDAMNGSILGYGELVGRF